jgi:hypothetical protein
MAIGEDELLVKRTFDGDAQVRYQIQSVERSANTATVTGEVVHDSPVGAATDLFAKAKFSVNGAVRETTQEKSLPNKEVIQFTEELTTPPNAEVGFAVQVEEPANAPVDEPPFAYDFVVTAESGEADSLEPQPVQAGVTRLRMKPGGATLTIGEERTLVIEGVTARGETFPLSTEVTFESSNPSVVFVDDSGELLASTRGSAAVTATFDGGIDNPSITENFTVVPPQDEQPEDGGGDEEQPPLPEEPEPINPELPQLNPEPGVYVLPFSVLNAAPFLQGVPDVTINVPTLSSIRDAVDRVTLSPQQAETAARNGVDIPELPDVPDAGDIFDELTSGQPFNSVPTLQELRTETQTAVDSIEIPEPPAAEDITDPVDSTIDALQEDLESFIDDTETFLDESISATEAVLDETLSGIDSAVGDVQESIDAVAADIDSGFSDVQDTLTKVQASIPSLEDIVADTTDAVITEIEAQIIPTQEGILLTDDPPRFFAIAIENFLQEALSESTKRQIGNSVAEER